MFNIGVEWLDNINELIEKYKSIEAINHAKRLMFWDMETVMPPSGIEERSEVLSNIENYQKKMYLELKDLVDKIEENDDYSKAIKRILNKQIHYYSSLPDEINKEITKISAIAESVWKIAKNRNNFKIVEPYLEKIVDLEIKISEYLGYKKHPYDALLDNYEEDFTVDDGDKIFDYLIKETKGMIDKVKDKEFLKIQKIKNEKYKKEWMVSISNDLKNIFKIPENKFRIDESVHPFTINISPDDVRITTKYELIDFKKSLFATIHEMGHAIYLLNINKEYGCTPLYSSPSFGFDESQSRFLENFVGKSKEFTEFIYPILKKRLPFIKKYDVDEIYYYFNNIDRTPIRIDADELTYNIHIAIRYDIEKNLIEGKYKVSEIPEIWDSKMEEYLGIRPKNYREGILQDIHWYQGSFGYFPTYTLGNIIAAIIWYKIKNIKEHLINGEFDQIFEFLKNNIHIYGSLYSPKELLKRSFNEDYNPEYLIKYFKEKFI